MMTLLLHCSLQYQGFPNSISDFPYQPSIKLIDQILFFKRSKDGLPVVSIAASFVLRGPMHNEKISPTINEDSSAAGAY